MLRVLALLALTAVVCTEDCRTLPPLWEGEVGTNVGSAGDGQGYFIQAHYHMWYDANQKKIALNGHVYLGGQGVPQKQLQDYENGKLYVVDNGNCKIIPIQGDVFAIQANATKVAEGYQGLPGRNSMNFTTYALPYPGPFFQGTQFITITSDCIMTGQLAVGEGVMAVNGYYNVKLGVTDPSVFNIPPECTTTGLFGSDRLRRLLKTM